MSNYIPMQCIRLFVIMFIFIATLYVCNRRYTNTKTEVTPAIVNSRDNSNVAVVTMSFHEFTRSSYTDFARVNKQKYCKIAGCKYLEGNSKEKDSMIAPWEKIPFALKAFKMDYKWIWMLDFDTIIMDPHFSVLDVIDDQHDFFITKDCAGFNAGSVVIRANVWTESFLNEVQNMRDDTKTISRSDSAIMLDLYERNWNNAQDHIKVLNQTSINAYPKEIGCSEQSYEKGKHPVLHFASCNIMGICGSLFKLYMYDTKV